MSKPPWSLKESLRKRVAWTRAACRQRLTARFNSRRAQLVVLVMRKMQWYVETSPGWPVPSLRQVLQWLPRVK